MLARATATWWRPPPASQAPQLVGLTSPSRLKHAPRNGGSPQRAHSHAPTVSLFAAPQPSFSQRASSDAAALARAWEAEAAVAVAEGGSGVAAAAEALSNMPFGHAAPPPWDPYASTLAAGARALVIALFRRLKGLPDPGKSGMPVRGFTLQLDSDDMLSYVDFVQWAAPLGKALTKMRQRVQAAFLASASTGGGEGL